MYSLRLVTLITGSQHSALESGPATGSDLVEATGSDLVEATGSDLVE